jgi:hypothetical protein
MQRLKGIHQYGTWHFINPKLNTSRFDHSLGVFFLLRKFNASIEEQIAGLIHDISHLAFSHVIDYVFEDISSQETAEKFNEEIIKKSEIPNILKEKNIDIDFILDKNNFRMLERSLPDICADRLDYLFRDSIIFGAAENKVVNSMLKSIIVKDGEFVVNNENNAKQIANLFLTMSRKMWVNPLQSASYQILADSIKIALNKKIITEKDFYLTDDTLFKKLKNSMDSTVTDMLNTLEYLKITEGTKNDYDFHTSGKARYIDPKFLDGKDIMKVSDVDEKFKKDIKEFIKWVSKGFYIKIIR